MSISFSVVVKNEDGLHARPASIFVHYFMLNGVDALIRYEDREVSGHSLLDVLSLCVPKGGEIHIDIAQDDRGGCGMLSVDEVERDIRELFDVVFMG